MFDLFYAEIEMAEEQIEQKELVWHERSNICAYLDEKSPTGKQLASMILFLKRSRIQVPISKLCVPYLSNIQEFWNTAFLDTSAKPHVIRAIVKERDILITPAIIREVCEFRDVHEYPLELPWIVVRGCLARAKYMGD